MELPSYFRDFLSAIRPRKDQLKALRDGHHVLRDRLSADAGLAPICVADFLQGSYRRSTAVRPLGEEKADVDIIVVTNLESTELEPADALEQFVPFLDTHYKGKWERQGRSLGIEMSNIKLDLVVTAAPSEKQKHLYKAESVRTLSSLEDLEEWRLSLAWPDPENKGTRGYYRRLDEANKEAAWKLEPLLIPDRDANKWQQTNPLAQIEWTWKKNKNCNKHYVSVVKAIKWWRRQHQVPEHPKSYPLEHLVGDNCPSGITSVAAGVTHTLEAIVSDYKGFAAAEETPYVEDRGVGQDVFRRVTGKDFAKFYALVEEAALIAREALEAGSEAKSAALWRKLFGERFPEGPAGGEDDGGSGGGEGKGGFSAPRGPAVVTGGRFA